MSVPMIVIPANAATQCGRTQNEAPLGPGYFACAKFRDDGGGKDAQTPSSASRRASASARFFSTITTRNTLSS